MTSWIGRILVALGLVPWPLLADCGSAPMNGESNTHQATRILFNQSIPTAVKNGILAGAEEWNACNHSTDWPFFDDRNLGQEDTLYITYHEGMNDEQACGSYDFGNGIGLWDSYLDDEGLQVNCTHSAAAISDIIAHELGHYLGLDHNDHCNRAIMGPTRVASNGNIKTDYDITAAEKWRVDAINTNAHEEWVEDCQEDPNCGEPNPSNTSPLLLDLDGYGFQLSGLSDPVSFDINANFTKDTIGWTARGSGDGFLYRNRYRTPGVDNGTELFGTATRSLLTGEKASDGYEALAEFDLGEFGGNQNGWIDAGDLFFPSLGVWIDRNHDAVSQEGELYSLAEAGVQRIRLQHWTMPVWDHHGNEFRFWSYAWKESPRGPRPMLTTDVFFVLEQ